MRRMGAMLSAVVALVVWPEGAMAGVVHAEAGAFAVHEEADVAAAPATVWAELARPADWWSPAHSWSKDAAHLTLDVREGGCFCETWPVHLADGTAGVAAVRHMTVLAEIPEATLVLSGALGPLQPEAAVGTLTIRLAPGSAAGHTLVTWDYAVAGYLAKGGTAFAPVVDAVSGELVRRLALRSEGRPVSAP